VTDGLVPLALPHADGYGPWLAERCDHHLSRVRELVENVRGLSGSTALEIVTAWNDVNLALGNVFSAASLLANVHPDEAVRTQAETAEQDAHRLLTDLSLDRTIYDVLAGADPEPLDGTARRMLEKSLLDFRRSGVDRDDETRDRLRRLAEQQTEVGQTFSKNIRDGVGRLRVEPGRLAGLPADFVEAHPPGDDGLVELTTEYPDYVPVMTFAADRELRREMVTAFLNRAWPQNDGVLRELLEVRRETADTLGYPDWPSYDAEVKMISTGLDPRVGSGAAIPEFIERISGLARESAERDFTVLLDRLRQDHPEAVVVDGTDKTFYSEVVRRERFDVDAQEVRRYFDFSKVRQGLLEVTGRLFGLEYVELPDVPRWHEDVTAYDVVGDLTGTGRRRLLGRIYLDLHPRPGKYSHAAQFDLVTGVAGTQLPEGVLVCNFPTGLMEHDDVVTLFHEFGHLVHHVLGGHQQWARFSGVATEWDFVEAPSQMLEEWAWDHSVLSTFATDASGQPIPAGLVARMRTAEEFGKGFLARTQMFYAAVSYRFHADVPEDLTAAVRELQGRYDLFGHLPGTHFQASFGHLGGYSSAYYTYMWSLVIAKDLFSAFDRDDLFAPDVAHRYRDRVLARGGSADAGDLVADFLGRPYGFEAFEGWLSS
jgi:thimet oligopeptidase